MERISCCLERPTFMSSFITQAIILAASAIKLNMFSCSICFRQTFTQSLWLCYTCTISQPILFSHHTLNSRGTQLPKKNLHRVVMWAVARIINLPHSPINNTHSKTLKHKHIPHNNGVLWSKDIWNGCINSFIPQCHKTYNLASSVWLKIFLKHDNWFLIKWWFISFFYPSRF